MKLDRESMQNFWMPFTGNRDFKNEPRMMVRAEGVYFWNDAGEKIIDASSGLFCCAAGHCRQEIADAVYRQMQTLDYSPPFQTAQPLAFEFANRVAALTPEGLDHIFFTNSGSESVDTAMKIAYAYHYARGEGQRQRFVSRERAYHGDQNPCDCNDDKGFHRPHVPPGAPSLSPVPCQGHTKKESECAWKDICFQKQ